MAKYWNRRLVRAIKLRDGTELATLRAAGEFLLTNLQGVIANAVLEHTGELLLAAATTGKRQDIEAATAQTEVLIRTRPWL
jgi:hypothetical protein